MPSAKESESMSDYMFMLESHLSSDQSRVVNEFQTAAVQANTNIFLTGGAMRDMLGGFPILEIDFTVEGNAIKLAQASPRKRAEKYWRIDENRKLVEMSFPRRRARHHRNGPPGEISETR